MNSLQRPPLLCNFSQPHPQDQEGYCGTSEKLDPELILDGLRQGVFPWSSEPANWFTPLSRSILFPIEIHLSKRWVQKVKKSNWTIKIDHCFSQVMRGCQSHPDSWVDQNFISSYSILHEAGYAHSFEVYNSENKLVGGVYGLHMGGVFSAESMFHTESNASKLCLASLCLFMLENNISLLDSQVLNPFTQTMGFTEIHREDFLEIHQEVIAPIHPIEAQKWTGLERYSTPKDTLDRLIEIKKANLNRD